MSPQTQRYLNGTRNKAKRAYGWRYWKFLESDARGLAVQEPEHPGIGTMAAQAVRMNLIMLRKHYG